MMDQDRERDDRAALLVIGSTAAALGLDAPKLQNAGITSVADLPDPAGGASWLVEALSSTDVIVLAIGPGGFSLDDRRVCLLARSLHGSMPIIALPADADLSSSARPDVADAVGTYARSLGGDRYVITSNAQALAAAIAEARQRRAAQHAAASLRMWPIARDDDAPSPILTGEVVAGSPVAGLEVVLLPSATAATIVRAEPSPDGSCTIHLDRPVAPRSGELLAAAAARPEVADQIAANVVWLAGQPMLPGRPYRLRVGTQSTTAQISALKHKVDPADLGAVAARRLERGDVGLCNLSFALPIAFDQAAADNVGDLETARFTLEDAASGDVLGRGRILFTLRRATNIHWQQLAIDKTARAKLKGQRPCCLWFTGLSGSGKSTVASLLEKHLSAIGRHTYTLDGDNVRHGLNRDLGFTDADRVENIRRVAEVSKLFVDSGLIVMVSFISPFRAERRMARALFPEGEFLEIHLDTPIEVCEGRDPKGLYKKARAGQLKNFTGIDSPYEPPERAELRLDSGRSAPEDLVAQVLDELARRGMV